MCCPFLISTGYLLYYGRKPGMKKALIVYESRTGKTKQMADYIAEGIRMNGGEVDLKQLSMVKASARN
jgi:flavodoxin